MATCCYKQQQQQLQPLLPMAETAVPETIATTFLADGVLQMTTDTGGTPLAVLDVARRLELRRPPKKWSASLPISCLSSVKKLFN